MFDRRRFLTGTNIFIGLIVLSGLLTFILPADAKVMAQYNLSDSQYKTLVLITRFPSLIAYGILYYTYFRLKKYAALISATKDGFGFTAIAKGVRWLAWGLPAAMLISQILTGMGNKWPGSIDANLIITNYIYVLISLVAFWVIGTGSHEIAKRAKVRIDNQHIRTLTFIFAVLAIFFCMETVGHLHGNMIGSNSFNAYYLPNWMVWISIGTPSLYAWFLGLFAVTELVLAGSRVSGVIYRQALQLLASGMAGIIMAMLALQYIRSIIPRTGRLTIGVALLWVYLIYVILVAACTLLLMGVRRLHRIEEA